MLLKTSQRQYTDPPHIVKSNIYMAHILFNKRRASWQTCGAVVCGENRMFIYIYTSFTGWKIYRVTLGVGWEKFSRRTIEPRSALPRGNMYIVYEVVCVYTGFCKLSLVLMAHQISNDPRSNQL